MIKAKVIFPMCLLFTSCATLPPETPAGKGVTVTLTDVPAGCKELKTIQWEGDRWHTQVDAKSAIREETAKLGGNFLRLESLAMVNPNPGSPYPLAVGTAYSCPK